MSFVRLTSMYILTGSICYSNSSITVYSVSIIGRGHSKASS